MREKLDQAEQLFHQGYNTATIAQKLGVSEPTLYRWRKMRDEIEAETGGEEPAGEQPAESAASNNRVIAQKNERIRRLEAEIARLKETIADLYLERRGGGE